MRRQWFPSYSELSPPSLATASFSRRRFLGRLTGGVAALTLTLVAAPRARAAAQEAAGLEPGRQQAGDRELVVSLWQQRLWAYEGDVPVLATWVSTGTAETWETQTPIGWWRILVKLPLETMTGTVNGEAYAVPDVPYVLYFTDEGHALHGTYWHTNFGTPMSHGCVNLPMDVAEWMYRWASEGTAVTILP